MNFPAFITTWSNRIAWSLRRLISRQTSRHYEQDLTEELRSHFEMRIQENLDAGMSPAEARIAAFRQFGWTESIKDECREQQGARWLENLVQDVRFGARQLRKNPGFTTIAVLTLALGIGVNTSMFSALQALINRPLVYPDPERLVQVFQSSPHAPREPHHSVPNFLDYEARSSAFEYVAAYNDKPFNLAEPDQPAERVPGSQVTASFFPLLGIQPTLGRTFTPDEDQPGRNAVVILENGFWLRRFAGDTNIVGRVLRLDGESVTVVGVMPPRFHDIMFMGPTSLWRPIAFTVQQRTERGNQFLKCIARIKTGLTLQQAQVATDVLAAQQRLEYRDDSPDALRIVPLAESSLPPQARQIVWSITALASFVLLIACANLANLQFAQTARRGRELAIRGALGGPRSRLLRQLITESLLLAALGGVLGLGFTLVCNALLARQFVVDGETVLNLPLNIKVIAFALIASCISGLAFGLAPAWLASRVDVNEALKKGARGATGDRSQLRLQHGLIVAEVALAMVLLAGAGQVVDGFKKFAKLDPGWRVDGMSLGYLTLPERKYGSDEALRTFVDRLQEKLLSLPGVERAAVCWTLPVRQFNVNTSFNIDGRPEPSKQFPQNCSLNGITPSYFKTLGMQLLEGRDFSVADTTNRPPVIIINAAMARSFWPGESPIGKRIDGGEIVGVVNDVRFPANPAEMGSPNQAYRPFAQAPRGTISVAVRGELPAKTLRQAVADVDPDQPVGNPGSARADVGRSLENWELGGRLLSLFALLGVSLAALGIYGVISGLVVRRTSEIGLRMALGAQIRDVLWLVIGNGLRLSIFGTVIGLVGAFWIARLLISLLPELPKGDPLVIALVAAALLVITLLSCWLPASRAARVDPNTALRSE